MEPASISALKKELQSRSEKDVIELCMRLAKYKKENKELLHYLLFESGDEEQYIQDIKAETDLQFSEINKTNIYYAKKSIRKILRYVNKHIKYSGNKQTEVELLIHYCLGLKSTGIALRRYPVLENLYLRQVQKIRKAMEGLHEDLQYDYHKELERL